MMGWRSVFILWFGIARDVVATKAPASLTTLDKDNFHDHLKNADKAVLVMFHVDWCGICKVTLPEFGLAAELAEQKGLKVTFAHVDCTDDKTVAAELGIGGYPSFKFWTPGQEAKDFRDYKSSRTSKAFADYAMRMSRPAVIDVPQKDHETVFGDHILSAFLLLGHSKDEVPQGFKDAAELLRDKHTFAVSGKWAEEEFGESKKGLIVAPPFKKPEDKTVLRYPGDLNDAAATTEWVQRNRFPGVWKLGDETFYDFTHSGRPCVIVVYDPKTKETVKELSAEIEAAQKEFGDEFYFGILDGVDWQEALDSFQIYPSELPRLLVTDLGMEGFWEDVYELPVQDLPASLRKIGNGEVGRQKRGMANKLFVTMRGGMRGMVYAYDFASESILNAVFLFGSVFTFLLLWFKCCVWCCTVLFEDWDDDEIDESYMRQKQE